jgi:putative hydrolase of the HAD superfamily
MIPKIIAFDLGKVLVDFDYSIAGRKIAAQSKLSSDEVKRFLDHSPLLVRYETGLISTTEFFAEVRRATGFAGSLEAFGGFFADIFLEIPDMIRLHAEFRERKIPTYIFSNTNDLAIGHVRRNFPFFQNFDGYIFSYEVRAMKPDAPIYEALEQLSGRRGAEILYLDDRRENVEAGARRGWQAILHETPEETRAALANLKLI